MSIKVSVNSCRENSRTQRRAGGRGRCLVGGFGVAMAVLVVTIGTPQSRLARGGDEPLGQAAAPPSGFAAESRESLRILQGRLVALGAQILDGLVVDDTPLGDADIQTLTVASAKAGFDRAVLVREAAEVALKEYQKGTFEHEKKSCETEIELAKAELERADRAIGPAREHYARIKQAGTGSVADLAAEWQFATAEFSARLQQKNAQLKLQVAQEKLKTLLEYTRPITEKQLMSSVEKARSDELARRADWGLEQAKLARLKAPARNPARLSETRKRILALLDRAIAIEEPLGAMLALVKPGTEPDQARRNEIVEKTSQLRDIVDQAQAEADAAALAALKLKIREAKVPSHDARAGALPQANSKDQVAPAAGPLVPLDLGREQVSTLEKQVLELGTRVMSRPSLANHGQLVDSVVNQKVTVLNAEAQYENAKLTREVAEIAVIEYTEGIYKQDKATLEGELKIAEVGPPRAADWVEILKDRLAKTRKASKGTAPELAYEFGLENRIAEFELSEPRKRLDLANAQKKLDRFLLFAKSKREKELQAEVKKAKADELARQAEWKRAQLQFRKLDEAIKRQGQEVHGQRVLALLERSVSTVEELKTKFAQSEKDPQPGAAIRTEIANLTRQLRALIEDAQREDAAAQWAESKRKVRDLSRGPTQ